MTLKECLKSYDEPLEEGKIISTDIKNIKRLSDKIYIVYLKNGSYYYACKNDKGEYYKINE